MNSSRLPFFLNCEASDSKARSGTLKTLHGEVNTPVFMPVATQATVRGQLPSLLKEVGAPILLANTYHLMLRPGIGVFNHFGGLHNFMNWDGPILTDSGGFQIFSLPRRRKMTEEGAEFTSYIDGKIHLLSPETSIGMQKAIGSDIMMVLDQCIPSTAGYEDSLAAMELTHRWALRSLEARGDSPQALFGIVQGACHPELRQKSAEFLRDLPFDGLAIGGLAVGETSEERDHFTGLVTQFLPQDRPRYLMGVGTPRDILEAVHRGVDMFDCIIPSQLGHRGVVFTSTGKLQLRRTAYRFSEEPLDEKCPCYTCRNFSKAFLHHLVKAGESLGGSLLATHNLAFYHRLMKEIQESILNNRFMEFYEQRGPDLILKDVEKPDVHQKWVRPLKVPRRGDFEVHVGHHGSYCIRQISSGEVMHSVIPPQEEAQKLYVEQSHLKQRLEGLSGSTPLILWDVGLGAGSNVMAAIECFEKAFLEGNHSNSSESEKLTSFKIFSFEIDLDPLHLAFSNRDRFPHLRHSAPHFILKDGVWEHPSGHLKWELKRGDFLMEYEKTPSPDLIFYDPFSLKSNGDLWSFELFEKLFRHFSNSKTELYTYSASTSVRVALLRGGFTLAEGMGTGPKESTTVAFNTLEGPRNHPSSPRILGESWLNRWRRSGSKFPPGLSDKQQQFIIQTVENHPQFFKIWT